MHCKKLSSDRELAAGRAIDGIADYAGEWVGGTGVHIGVGAAGALADKTAFRIPPQPCQCTKRYPSLYAISGQRHTKGR